MRTDHHHHEGDLDRGLAFDLAHLTSRRRALQVLGVGGLLALVGCSSAGSDGGAAGGTTAGAAEPSTSGTGAACETIPAETAGPFPGDGSNGPDALGADGVVRTDLTTDIGSTADPVPGVPLELELVIVDAASGCAPLAGAAVYAWHCDAIGRYSMYSEGVEDRTFLRGVQVADEDGVVRFATVFPGCYPGRWPHVHFEVFESVESATGGGSPLATSQLAFPEATSAEVYGVEDYGPSSGNLGQLTLEGDMIFADGADQQLAAMSGTVDAGLTARLSVPV